MQIQIHRQGTTTSKLCGHDGEQTRSGTQIKDRIESIH